MNEANNLPEDQELSWAIEEYLDWAEKHKYEFITAHNGRMGAAMSDAKIKIEIHEGKAHVQFETDVKPLARYRRMNALDNVLVSVETLLVFYIREVI